MEKSNKELAVELAGNYLRAIYSRENTKIPDPTVIKNLLQACYDAVTNLPDD